MAENEKYLKGKDAFREKFASKTGRAADPSARIPPGQHQVDTMVPMPPIGADHPVVLKEKWALTLHGLVENPAKLDWKTFTALAPRRFVVDFHCVTTWSKLDQSFTGVPWSEILKLARPKPQVKHVLFESYDGYTTNVPMSELDGRDDIFIAFEMDGREIPPQYGGPARVVIPHLYAWKSAKYVNGVRFMENDQRGFWERRGYHNHADPWTEERFSSQE